MKKILSAVLTVPVILALSACSNVSGTNASDQSTSQQSNSSSESNASQSGTTLPQSSVTSSFDQSSVTSPQSGVTSSFDQSSATSPQSGGASSSDQSTANSPQSTETNALGAMSPEEALEYMKTTENLVIVDVAAARWFEEEHFEGAIHIPIEELNSAEEDALYAEIPAGHPVIMHCRRGMIVPGAYRRVLELRSDIPEIAYIDGTPPFAEYNEWLAAR